MKTETLFEIEDELKLGPLAVEDSLALLREVWRLKTALTGKNIDLGYWRDSFAEAKTDLDRLIDENQRLNEEVSRLVAVMGLPRCELESRWSNCAVRRIKCASDDGICEEETPKLLSWNP